ncbi:hypothetical protein FKW77_003634 [Venturia effusa]|uniref:Large ribosomal subunit protein mL49 n=1 Tax=Venturia effusa TaxID=50376 RepID=A0A517L739_9PEZI|nr:hypothetical protein FKW77_003634 [Venturia effusa]
MALQFPLYRSFRAASITAPFQCLRFSTVAPLRDVLRDQTSPKSPTAEPRNRSPRPQSTSRPSTSKLAPSSTPTLPVTAPAPELLPYHVSRSRTRNLPVYSDWKAGGNLKHTRIRGIIGNKKTLREDLARELQIDPGLVTIGKITGHIVIKGQFKEKVMAFLQAKGF